MPPFLILQVPNLALNAVHFRADSCRLAAMPNALFVPTITTSILDGWDLYEMPGRGLAQNLRALPA